MCYACLFDRRSKSIYDGLRGRLAAKKWKSGPKAGQIRKPKIDIPYTLEQFRAWLTCVLEDTPHCEYCTDPIDIMTISPDHAKPISRGGSLELKNLRGACDVCNRIKGELLPGEFKALLAGLATFTQEGRNDIIKRLKGVHIFLGNKKKQEPDNQPTKVATAVKQLKASNVLALPAKQRNLLDDDF